MGAFLHTSSATMFYLFGALAFLAHLVGFVKNYMKIREMRQKSKDRLRKTKTTHQKMQRRWVKARDVVANKPRRIGK